MLTIQEFKNRYSSEILEEGLTEQEVVSIYENIYLEDPMQFTSGMIDKQNT
jgi:hypothetical protein